MEWVLLLLLLMLLLLLLLLGCRFFHCDNPAPALETNLIFAIVRSQSEAATAAMRTIKQNQKTTQTKQKRFRKNHNKRNTIYNDRNEANKICNKNANYLKLFPMTLFALVCDFVPPPFSFRALFCEARPGRGPPPTTEKDV